MADTAFEENVLRLLKGYRDNMSEFLVEEMDYIIDLVERDIELKDF